MLRLTFLSVSDEGSLDEIVVKGAGQPTFVAFGWKSVERIGEVGGNLGATVRGKEGLESVGCRFSWVVSDAGFEPDRDDSVGALSNNSVVNRMVLVAPCSMIGSANRSSTRSAMRSWGVSPLMR